MNTTEILYNNSHIDLLTMFPMVYNKEEVHILSSFRWGNHPTSAIIPWHLKEEHTIYYKTVKPKSNKEIDMNKHPLSNPPQLESILNHWETTSVSSLGGNILHLSHAYIYLQFQYQKIIIENICIVANDI